MAVAVNLPAVITDEGAGRIVGSRPWPEVSASVTNLTNVAFDDAKHAKLVQWFEDAEEATTEARQKAERDRDYYDNKQLTQDEYDELVRRGQPPIAFNLIGARVDYLAGLEKNQRRDPKAYPRNPQDEEAADAFTDGLRYAAENADYPSVRSAAWKNIVIEGYGGVELSVPGENGEIALHHIPWDRIFYDPHACKPDFSDARYLGQVLWMDADEASDRYGMDVGELWSSLMTSSLGETYDDKPRVAWFDARRHRVRVIVMWYRKGADWCWCEFTKGAVLNYGENPYWEKDGEDRKPFCPLVLESAHIDRDNNRYGVVRALIDPQDEVNKRHSKGLHLLSSKGVIAEEGAVADIAKTRRELAKPDFYVEVVPGMRFEIEEGAQLAQGQVALMQEAKGYIMQQGPNAALLGKGTEDQSGRAIEAQQAGGLVELGDLMDSLRRMDRRVFRMMAAMIQQFWTAEKWIRVTDDEMNPQYVGLNVPVGVMTQYGPMQTGIQNNVAELDVDIIVGDTPPMITLQGETYTGFIQALPALAQMPPAFARMAIEMNPGLRPKQKKELLDMLQKQGQEDPQAAQMEAERMAMMKERAHAETEKIKGQAFQAVASGEASLMKARQSGLQTVMEPFPA